PILNEIAEQNSERLKVAKLNVDNNQQLAQTYNVRNIPTLLIFKDGKEINRVVGVKTKKHILLAVKE
ncbi:MAG TPA: thioredoxin domain-containing protein, partial [Bacteroidales bacterium]|nr:thioredoxin domain-containing protein [Bacteroidales bacterium]